MKIALIGKGKTGGTILSLVAKENIIGPFDRSHPLDVEKINQADVAIVFIPGEELKKIFSLLLKIKIPLIIGSTGMNFSEDERNQLITHQSRWVWGTNFSLGVYLFLKLIKTINTYQKILPPFNAELSDIHHIHKKDSPSGTALSLKQTAHFDLTIHSKRTGDVVGDHSLELNFPQEKLTILHQAINRELFAEGALKVATLCFENKPPIGLTLLETFLDQRIKL
jgi:4-hydroxy-tetrahydrodipicolinate reductase